MFIYYIIVTSFFPVQNCSNVSNFGSRKCEEGAWDWGAAWSGNDQNIAENGWLLPFFAGGDAGKWVKESEGHLPWSGADPGGARPLLHQKKKKEGRKGKERKEKEKGKEKERHKETKMS